MVNKGEIYLHFKGGKYGVIEVARHCDTEEEFVVYRDLSTGIAYIRKLNEFEEIMTSGIKRFTLIDKVTINN